MVVAGAVGHVPDIDRSDGHAEHNDQRRPAHDAAKVCGAEIVRPNRLHQWPAGSPRDAMKRSKSDHHPDVLGVREEQHPCGMKAHARDHDDAFVDAVSEKPSTGQADDLHRRHQRDNQAGNGQRVTELAVDVQHEMDHNRAHDQQ